MNSVSGNPVIRVVTAHLLAQFDMLLADRTMPMGSAPLGNAPHRPAQTLGHRLAFDRPSAPPRLAPVMAIRCCFVYTLLEFLGIRRISQQQVPAVHPAALRCLRLAVPQSTRFVSLPGAGQALPDGLQPAGLLQKVSNLHHARCPPSPSLLGTICASAQAFSRKGSSRGRVEGSAVFPLIVWATADRAPTRS
jgi:hypothetical protein